MSTNNYHILLYISYIEYNLRAIYITLFTLYTDILSTLKCKINMPYTIQWLANLVTLYNVLIITMGYIEQYIYMHSLQYNAINAKYYIHYTWISYIVQYILYIM